MSRFSDESPLPGPRTRLEGWEDRLFLASWVLKGVVGWGLVPLSLIFMLLIVATQASSLLMAAQADGTPGQFLAERRECSARGGCSWYGSFTADDGTVRLKDALFDEDPPGWAQGSAASVIWTGGQDPVAVYRPGDSTPLLLASGMGLLALLGLVAWVVALSRRMRSRPYPRWLTRLQEFTDWR